MSFGVMVAAAADLDLQGRSRRWSSLSYCVLDAVWSISSRYDEVVVPLVRRVAEAHSDPYPVVAAAVDLPADPLPLPLFLDRYPIEETLRVLTNSQRTSTTNGIAKAEAVLRYARILVRHGVTDLTAATDLMRDQARWDAVDRDLAEVPGDGSGGVRRRYLWMLAGSDDLVKPDRMVLRWLDHNGCRVTAMEARDVLTRAARELTVRLHRPVTPWMLDHAIWKDQRAEEPKIKTAPTIVFDVLGVPPIKNEALSLFSAHHKQRQRVEDLLAAALGAARNVGWVTTGETVGLDVTVRSPLPKPPGDATNVLGGIADVLHGRKTKHGLDLSFLGKLAEFALFDDDSQIQEIVYRFVSADVPSYTVQVTRR